MSTPNPRVIKALLMGLNPNEVQELQDLLEYLGEKAGPSNPSGQMPEGSVAALLNRASPAVRQRMAMLSDLVETPRHRPFQDKWDEAEYFKRLGMDVPASTQVKAALDGQEVMARTLDRMGGGDSTLPPKPLSDRDILSAAYDLHTGGK